MDECELPRKRLVVEKTKSPDFKMNAGGKKRVKKEKLPLFYEMTLFKKYPWCVWMLEHTAWKKNPFVMLRLAGKGQKYRNCSAAQTANAAK